jgi:hypothetical protein
MAFEHRVHLVAVLADGALHADHHAGDALLVGVDGPPQRSI